MSGLTQAERPIVIASPLGEDVLLVRTFTGREGLNELFDFTVDVILNTEKKKTIEPNEIVGQAVTLAIRLPNTMLGAPRFRHFNGVVSDFVQTSKLSEKFPTYRLRLRPWLWLLTRTADCHIFQEMTAIDIIQKIFTDFKFANFKNNTTKSYEKREYCVQYRETAANFVMRLFEEEGIFFHFEHEEKKHTLVFADNSMAAKDLPIQDKYRWEPVRGTAAAGDEDTISEFERRFQIEPMRWMQQDYNFEKPRFNLKAEKDSVLDVPVPKYEIFDYPGLFKESGHGNSLTGVRMEESEAGYEVSTGQSIGRSMAPGFKFQFTDHPTAAFNGKYFLTAVVHQGGQSAFRSDAQGDIDHYSNTFVCIPATRPYRHPRVTPKPAIHGIQTAFVVGPAGEEIYVDKYGRIKVQFHWDRYGKANESSSCWMRVQQSIAGISWGSIYTPRIGQEVVVEFLEGDADRPLVTGSVYNALNMPPYTLPDEKTKTTFKSNSTKGGGGFNELRFEDKKGSEQIYIQAQKQLDLRVNADNLEFTGADKHEIVKKNRHEKVEGSKHQEIKGDHNEKVGGSDSLSVGGNRNVKITGNWAVDATQAIHLKAGPNFVAESSASLTIKVGGNFININSGGIFIKGTMVMLNSGGAAGSGPGSNPASPQAPKEADNAQPGKVDQPPAPKSPPTPPKKWTPCALTLKNAARTGAPFCEICNQ